MALKAFGDDTLPAMEGSSPPEEAVVKDCRSSEPTGIPPLLSCGSVSGNNALNVEELLGQAQETLTLQGPPSFLQLLMDLTDALPCASYIDVSLYLPAKYRALIQLTLRDRLALLCGSHGPL